VVPLTIAVVQKFVPQMDDFVSYVETAYAKADSTQSDSLVDALIADLENIDLDSLKANLEKTKAKFDSLGIQTDLKDVKNKLESLNNAPHE
jgi:predicted nucleotide-binding protein (sugar kinase/HSP70/actin superfamily)